MSLFRTLALPVLLILGMIGFDPVQAAGDLTLRTEALPDLVLGSENSDYSLSRTEYQLLELFLANPRRVLSRDVIFDKVWGYDFGPDSNSLDVYIGYLRRKLGEPRIIHTMRGVGYVLREA